MKIVLLDHRIKGGPTPECLFLAQERMRTGQVHEGVSIEPLRHALQFSRENAAWRSSELRFDKTTQNQPRGAS
jgi:hypothetical protein